MNKASDFRHARQRARRGAGFTLLELLVAIALMGVLAVLCWRGLDSVITSRDRITAAANEMRALSTAFTQMDVDLRASWPVRLFRLRQRPVGFVNGPTERDPLMLVLLREGSALEPAQLQRVVYRLNRGVLERGFSQWQSAGFEREIDPERLVWQPLINGVSGLAFRGWVGSRGWLAGQALTDLTAQPIPAAVAAAPDIPYDGPVGLEVSIVRNGQSLRRVFAIED